MTVIEHERPQPPTNPWLIAAALAVFALGGWLTVSQKPPPSSAPPVADTRNERREESAPTRPELTRPAPAPKVAGAQGVPASAPANSSALPAAISGLRPSTPKVGSVLSSSGPIHLKLPRLPAAQRPAAVRAASSKSAAKLPPSPHWNYWLETNASVEAIPHPELGTLQTGIPHRLEFRLSMMDLSAMFERVGSTEVSKQAISSLRSAAMDPTRTEFPVTVVVHSVDDEQLQIVNGTDLSTAVVNLAAFRNVLLNPAAQPGPGAGKSILDELRRATVAQFSFQFVARTLGTHEASVTLVDSATGYPLESLMIDISPGKAWPQSVRVDQGASRLFSRPSAAFDLALFLYELKTTAMPERPPKLIAELWLNDPVNKKRNLITWRTNTDWDGAKQFVSDLRQDQNAKVVGSELLKRGSAFGEKLFNPYPPGAGASPDVKVAIERDIRSAELARRIIVERANYPADAAPPTLVTRVFSKSLGRNPYESLILPFGALGVSDAKLGSAYLGQRFAVSLLLAGQEVSDNAPCPSAWHFSIPSFTSKPDSAIVTALDGLKGLDQKWTDFELVQDTLTLDKLSAWLHDGQDAKDTYVFAYLGHQASNKLYLSGQGGVFAQGIRRQFNGNSVAILNACTTVLDQVNSETIIGTLSERSVAATIATTASVEGSLAAHYVLCMQGVLDARKSLTAAQANTLTIQCLWSPEAGPTWPGKPTMEHTGEALAYMTIGNPFQRICAPAKRAMQ